MLGASFFLIEASTFRRRQNDYTYLTCATDAVQTKTERVYLLERNTFCVRAVVLDRAWRKFLIRLNIHVVSRSSIKIVILHILQRRDGRSRSG